MVDDITFVATIRYFRPELGSGLAVAEVPPELVATLGGLKQLRVVGTINGAAYTSSTMPAGGGRLAVSVSKAMMKAGGVAVWGLGGVHRCPGEPAGSLIIGGAAVRRSSG